MDMNVGVVYHETITIACVLLIADRRRDRESWVEFAARNPDLLQWPCPAHAWYPAQVLDSPRSRDVFLVPDVTPFAPQQSRE